MQSSPYYQIFLNKSQHLPLLIQTNTKQGVIQTLTNSQYKIEFLFYFSSSTIPMQKDSSIQKFKQMLRHQGHYTLAYINFLVNLIDSQQNFKTYQQIYQVINQHSQKIVDYFMENPEELSLIDNKNPLCFNSIKEYFLQILRVVHRKYGYDIAKFKEGLKHTSKEFKTVLQNSTSRIVKTAQIIAKQPGLKRIMVYSYSKSVALSLKNLASMLEGSLQIYVCKGGQLEEGARMYNQLSVTGTGAKISLINDNQIGYYLQKVDMVLSGAQSILQNGSIINRSGSLCLAIAAYEKGKKFYVFAESHKYLKRIYFSGSDIPQLIKKTKEGHEITMDDLVPSRYISLFFTDLGVFTPEVVAAELVQMFQ